MKPICNAIILCAGRGVRYNITSGTGIPKCLIRLNGETIIDRQIRLLRACGVDDITIAYSMHPSSKIQREQILQLKDVKFFGVEMPNSRGQYPEDVYTLVKCRPLLSNTLILLGDVVFAKKALEEILSEPFEDIMIIRNKEGNENFAIRINEKGLKNKFHLIRPRKGLWKHFKIGEMIRTIGHILHPKIFVSQYYIADVDNQSALDIIKRKIKELEG